MVVSRIVYGESLTLGAGYNVIAWLAADTRAWWAVALLLALRTAATSATVGGGGAGGLFVPLVVGGALVGRLCGGGLAEPTQTLFPVIGVAAFLGAGYRTPLAAVMFVAESTGRPGFIVPGLIATVVSQLMMGSSSVSTYQSSDRSGHLERRFGLPLTAAIQGDVLTTPPDTTLDHLIANHLLVTRHTTVPVLDRRHLPGTRQRRRPDRRPTTTSGPPRPSGPSPATTHPAPARAGRLPKQFVPWTAPASTSCP